MGQSCGTRVPSGPAPRVATTGRSPGLSFFLFILLNAVLFIRPVELFPSLGELPIYNVIMVASLAVSASALIAQVAASIGQNPINTCVLGMLFSVLMSHLNSLRIREAIDCAIDLSKVLLYYYLLVSVLDSSARIRRFLVWLCLFVLVLVSLALLHYHKIITIESLDAMYVREWELVDAETGEAPVLARLQGVGIYGNPNDLSRILVVGMLIGIWFLGDRGMGLLRAFWVPAIALYGYGLQLTYSRGGLLSLLGGVAALFYSRLGAKKSLLATAVVLPVLMVAFGGRQTQISTSQGTAQERIKLWNEGFVALQTAPVFGIGMNNYAREFHLVAHNSFVHCYTELGIIGGMFFFGLTYLPARALCSRMPAGRPVLDSDSMRLQPLMLALVISTVIGMVSSTRSYSHMTYLIVGLAAAHLRVLADRGNALLSRFNGNLFRRLFLMSNLTLIGFYIYVRMSARY